MSEFKPEPQQLEAAKTASEYLVRMLKKSGADGMVMGGVLGSELYEITIRKVTPEHAAARMAAMVLGNATKGKGKKKGGYRAVHAEGIPQPDNDDDNNNKKTPGSAKHSDNKDHKIGVFED